MIIKTSELKGAALDYMLARVDPRCSGIAWRQNGKDGAWIGRAEVDDFDAPVAYLRQGHLPNGFRYRAKRQDIIPYWPSVEWRQGGVLIEENHLMIESDMGSEWCAMCVTESPDGHPGWIRMEGPTLLIAACRAIVRAKLGEEVDVPEELL